MAKADYIASRDLSTTLFLGLALERPVFLEGAPGVGKTEVAKVMAQVLGRPLVRLQCYEGIDRQTALYEWNYSRQLLRIRLIEAAARTSGTPDGEWRQAQRAAGALGAQTGEFGDQRQWEQSIEAELFGPEFLLERPLLAAVRPNGPAPVLLIDEIDRSDEEFEAFLLELLAEYQVTIPEWGTVRAQEIPLVVLTSNRTREVHDALKRRCLYAWLDYPSFHEEYEIVRRKAPNANEQLTTQVCAFVQRLRHEPLFKLPGVSETINWAHALHALHTRRLDENSVAATLGCLLKYRDDLEHMTRPRDAEHTTLTHLLSEIGVRQ